MLRERGLVKEAGESFLTSDSTLGHFCKKLRHSWQMPKLIGIRNRFLRFPKLPELYQQRLQPVENRELEWLLAVAPYIHVGYNADDFIEELERLVNVSPANICVVLGKVLESFVPTFDFQDRLKSLLIKLWKLGKSQEAISYANQLRHLPGMAQLFTKMTEGTI